MLLVRIPHQLAEQVVIVAVKWIELVAADRFRIARTAIDAAIGPGLAERPLIVGSLRCRDHRREIAEAHRAGAVLEEALVVGVVTGVDLAAELAALEIVLRILGGEGDDAAQRVGAPHHAGRPAHDLDRLQVRHVDEVAVAIDDALDHAGTVDQHLHAVVGNATDGEAGEIAEWIGARGGLGDRDPRFVTHEILDVAHHALVELLAPDDRDVLGKIENLTRVAIGIDADRVQHRLRIRRCRHRHRQCSCEDGRSLPCPEDFQGCFCHLAPNRTVRSTAGPISY